MVSVEIPLTQGKVALIDEEDFSLVSQFQWHAADRKHTFYAASMGVPGYYMHRLIMGAKPGQHVDHRNGNGLDNRRENLRVCSNAENRRNTRKTRGVSRYKGVAVCRSNPGRPWQAARAYNAAAQQWHGEFAHINVIEGLSYEESVTPPVRNRKPGRPFSRTLCGTV